VFERVDWSSESGEGCHIDRERIAR
jgi:hypothetical protein